MATTKHEVFDDTGKVVFDDYYNQPDPRAYFSTLRELDYRIAGEAQPVVRTTLDTLRSCRGEEAVKVVDLGASYGINSALLRCDVSLDDLNDRYSDPGVGELDRDELLQRDRQYYRELACDPNIETVGIDPAANAIDYGVEAGLLDHGIATNLEEAPLAHDDAEAVAGADLVISTGCIGYVSETSIERLLDATGDDRPWMAHTVLRMFSFGPYIDLLRDRGYATERLEGTLLQRRFANDDERQHALDNLEEVGVDPSGKETSGWYHANVYISRPIEEAGAPIAAQGRGS